MEPSGVGDCSPLEFIRVLIFFLLSAAQEQVLGGCIKSYMKVNRLEALDTIILNGLKGGNKLRVKAGVEKAPHDKLGYIFV